MCKELTEELRAAIDNMLWQRGAENPYTNYSGCSSVNITHKRGTGRDRWYSWKTIEGPRDLVLEHARFEVYQSLQATTPYYEHMAYRVEKATELGDGVISIKLRNSFYAGD